jgi:hypothetical protein
MNEVARLCMRDKLALGSPAYVAVSREYVRNRLLISVMVDSRAGAGLDFKSAAPQGRIYGKFGRNRGSAFRTRCLCGTEVELLWADNADRLELSHGTSEWLEVDGSERKGVPEPGPLKLTFKVLSRLREIWRRRVVLSRDDTLRGCHEVRSNRILDALTKNLIDLCHDLAIDLPAQRIADG